MRRAAAIEPGSPRSSHLRPQTRKITTSHHDGKVQPLGRVPSYADARGHVSCGAHQNHRHRSLLHVLPVPVRGEIDPRIRGARRSSASMIATLTSALRTPLSCLALRARAPESKDRVVMASCSFTPTSRNAGPLSRSRIAEWINRSADGSKTGRDRLGCAPPDRPKARIAPPLGAAKRR